jgi:tetratricopeptide (TPR) repeat protein
MQQNLIFSSISIGERGKLVVNGAVITQQSLLYHRLAIPGYLNPRALSGAELMNARFDESTAKKFANAITNTAIRIRAEHPRAAPGTDLSKAIAESIAMELGTGQDAKNILESRNAKTLALFDVCAILNMGPELSIGQNYDLVVEMGGAFFGYPDEQSRYKAEERETRFVATTPAQACSAVHLILGNEAEKLAQDRKRTRDALAWKTEIADAIKHYEDAISFAVENEEARYNLSGAYAKTGQHGKAADIYKEAFELSPQKNAKAYYLAFHAENTIYTKDIGRMIGALRMIEEFCSLNAQCSQAMEAAEALRIALAKMLKS